MKSRHIRFVVIACIIIVLCFIGHLFYKEGFQNIDSKKLGGKKVDLNKLSGKLPKWQKSSEPDIKDFNGIYQKIAFSDSYYITTKSGTDEYNKIREIIKPNILFLNQYFKPLLQSIYSKSKYPLLVKENGNYKYKPSIINDDLLCKERSCNYIASK
jgi:hypothetical protein